VTKPDDQRLLSDLRAGCLDACAEIVRNHYQAVYRFLVHMTRDMHEAEDLTQETFAAAWERIGSFQGRATLATWLHRIAYTKFIDAQRAERRAAGLRERLTNLQALRGDQVDALEADDETRRLYRVLYKLDPAERTLLVLHYLQGLSYREMAAVLDEPSGTVKWRTAEALKTMRAMLVDEDSHHAIRTIS
jgi:RNA polymerase sigma-70 factor (ECF subfamily)